MQQNNIILSVMVISHNQVHLIGRCLESILRQRIRVPWEIVISDDASTDGTWEWIQEFAKQEHEPEIIITQINSSDYNPTVTSDRCAANKANVYMHARGKYCVNIDADDYLLGDDIYQYQIDQLETHPECAVAVQNILNLKDGDDISNGHTWWPDNHWDENEMFTVEQFCDRRLFISNPALMMRRDPELNPMERYGLLFDDPVISMHHMAKGKIITSQKAQYVYVQYNKSIWNAVTHSDDAIVRTMTPLIVYKKLFPQLFEHLFWMEHFVWISRIKLYLKKEKRLNLSPLTIKYVERLNCKVLNNMIATPRCFMSRVVLLLFLFVSKFNLHNQITYKLCRLVLS